MTKPLAGRRVMLVEDDYYLAQDAREWLEQAGAEVIGPFASADEACRQLGSTPIDAAVIDINLGEGPTYRVAGELSDQSVPFLFATGYDPSVIPPHLSDRPRLEKPFRGHQLVKAVQTLA